MSLYSPSIEKLIESFERLPSIGHKTAARLAFYILNSTDEETKQFVNSIIDAKKNLNKQHARLIDKSSCNSYSLLLSSLKLSRL